MNWALRAPGQPKAGPIMVFDLAVGVIWPFKDSSVTEVRCHHLIEHIPAQTCFVIDGHEGDMQDRPKDCLFFFFDECERVMAPGARMDLRWPAAEGRAAYQDPTHRRFLALGFVDYLTRRGRERLGVSAYNVQCDFELEQLATVKDLEGEPFEHRAVLRKRQE